MTLDQLLTEKKKIIFFFTNNHSYFLGFEFISGIFLNRWYGLWSAVDRYKTIINFISRRITFFLTRPSVLYTHIDILSFLFIIKISSKMFCLRGFAWIAWIENSSWLEFSSSFCLAFSSRLERFKSSRAEQSRIKNRYIQAIFALLCLQTSSQVKFQVKQKFFDPCLAERLKSWPFSCFHNWCIRRTWGKHFWCEDSIRKFPDRWRR